MINRILVSVGKYVFINIFLVLPIFIILLGFDFIFDLQFDFFSGISLARIIFFIWWLVITIAFLWSQIKDEIDDIL